jgi:hypothetical protein
MEADDVAIVGRVGHEQDQPICAEVPLLRTGATLESLNVTQVRLGLHQLVAAPDGENRIAAASITRDWDRHFDPPPDAGVEAPAKSREQPKVARVPHSVTGRMERCGELQAKDRCDPRGEIDRQRGW